MMLPAPWKANWKRCQNPRRLVLCPCSPGQVSLASQPVGRSIFSFYFEEGLRGWADGYGSRGSHDGWITVRELEAFLQARVDRWAQRNRGLRQTPILYGSADDFNLASIDLHETPGHVADPPAMTYPTWLKEAWKQYDQAMADGGWRLTPRTFRQQQAWLLRADIDWRGGVDASLIQSRDLARVQQLKHQAANASVLPFPQPQSLAFAFAFGGQEDKESARLLQEFYARVRPLKPADPARAKLTEEFAEKFAKAAPLARAAAVMRQALLENDPTRERIDLLANLIDPDSEKLPQYVESLLLKRLAEMSKQPGVKTWPTASIRQLLQATVRGETANSVYEVNSWNEPLLAEADRLRHDGEVLFYARGYGSLTQAEQLLIQASAKYALAQRRADIVVKARQVLDDALLFLPAYAKYLDGAPDSFSPWLNCVITAQQLLVLLDSGAEPDRITPRNIDGIEDAVELLHGQLTNLRQPFTAETVALLVRRAKLPKADPAAVKDLHAVLATPFLKSEAREAVCQASFDLEKRLHLLTMQLDREEDDDRTVSEPLEPPAAAEAMKLEYDRANRRATASIALLELAGLPTDKIGALRQLLDDARRLQWHFPSPAVLGDALAQAWSKLIPEQFQAETSLAGKDRLSRFLPPLDAVPLVDDLLRSLPVQIRQREAKALFVRLGETYRYQSRDYRNVELDWSPLSSGERFYAQAALAYLPEPASQPEVSISGGALPRLSVERGSAECQIQLDWSTTKVGKDTIDVLVRNADPTWLTITPPATQLRGFPLDPTFPLALAGKLHLDVRLLAGKEGERGPPPRGFLVEADLVGRHYHFKVPVPIQLGPDQPHLLLSTSPQTPVEALQEIRLRPGKIRQQVYLFARNPSDTARKVTIEIKAGDIALKGGTFTKVLPPQSVERISLGGGEGEGGEAAGKPAKDLPPLPGPLQWRMLDADLKNEVIEERTIPVVVATPRDYVRVTNLVFAPPVPDVSTNRFAVTAQVYAPPGGTDIPIELVLAPDRIPGLVKVTSGACAASCRRWATRKAARWSSKPRSWSSPRPTRTKASLASMSTVSSGRSCSARHSCAAAPQRRHASTCTPVCASAASISRGPTPSLAYRSRPTTRPKGPPWSSSSARSSPASSGPPCLPESIPPPNGNTSVSARKALGVVLSSKAPCKIGSSRSTPAVCLASTTFVSACTTKPAKKLPGPFTPWSSPTQVRRAFRILGTPKAAKRGTRIVMQASASDLEAGIKEAQFFIGKPIDSKLPPNIATYQASPVDKGRTTWQAEVTMPEEKKGPTEVTVQVTNNAGLSSFATAVINLVDTDPAKTGPGRIKGRVLLGEVPQSDLVVQLRDDKGAEKAKTNTKADGTFLFEEVPPGRYSVYTRKNSVQRDGTAPAVVVAYKDTEVTINLVLRVTKKG